MDRVIKFRAWLPTIKKMTYPGTIEGIIKWAPFGCTPVWLQFTGLTDKKGKEIYEGDVIKRDSSMYTRRVIYCAPKFIGQVNEYDLRNSQTDLSQINDYEVIGNIYENPELIS